MSVIQTGAAFDPVGDMFNLYQYNSRSEVVDAVRYFGSNTNDTTNPVGLQDWSYSYDNIGNRSGTMKANAAANYTANALNQYTERTVHGSSDILGSAEQDVTITVNEEEANRQDYYWYHRLIVDNLFNPIYTQVVVEAIYDPGTNDPYVVSSETGSVFVAESPEVFTYDDDGNLLSDGRFDYQWDGENRLNAVTTADGLPEDMPVVHVEFAYDYMSRRVGKQVYEWDDGGTNWVEQSSATFVYDGWNFVRSTTLSNDGVITNMFVWGLDLASATLSHDGVSGSLQGAGGIGGLLATIHGTNAYFVTYDANGNVSEYVDASGDIAAHYEYSPFGETIVSTGPKAQDFAHRFSTKYFDDETGLAYYGYRYYSPGLGRWINRDPIGEMGGLNLVAFVANNPILRVDLYGLCSKSWILLIDERCLEPRSGESGVICRGGQIEIFIAPIWDQEGCNRDCIRPCVVVHENVHKAHLERYPYDEVCEGREGHSARFPPLDRVRESQSESRRKNVASEIIALTRELACLRGILQNERCRRCCEGEIKARIGTQEGTLETARNQWNSDPGI